MIERGDDTGAGPSGEAAPSTERSTAPAGLGGSEIRALPAHLVNQIAAGEVIERPGSVVKELVENAIDAGAREIRVEVEEGGTRLIRVSDDGWGIAEGDLPLALAAHATSKLRDEADLHRILTLGFRGEALASIASVSELELASRPPGRDAGASARASAGTVTPGPPVAMPAGTRVTVRNLFHNVPARKRFLKSERAELARVRGALQELALPQPGIGFTLLHGGKTLFRYPSGQDAVARVAEVLGGSVAERLISLPEEHPRLRGWVGRPDLHRRTSEGVRIYLNGRSIRDRGVLHAVRRAYQGYQIPGRFPVAVLYLELPPDDVDVNVHPTKVEVRLRDAAGVHRLVYRGVAAALAAAGCVPDLVPGSGAGRGTGRGTVPSAWRRGPAAGAPPGALDFGVDPFGTAPPGATAASASRSAAGGSPRVVGGVSSVPAGSEPSDLGEPVAARSHARPEDVVPCEAAAEPAVGPFAGRAALAGERVAEPAARALVASALVEGEEHVRVVQVHDAYLIVEERDGLVVIDQHALHEKVLFEEILARRERGTLRQPLLIPETAQLEPAELERLAEARPAITELGFEVEEFGEGTVALRAVPAGLPSADAADVLRALLARLDESAAATEAGELELDLRGRLLATVACKRAVKAGQRLTADMQIDLVRARARAFHPQNCPHGRPAELFISWSELERRFDRK